MKKACKGIPVDDVRAKIKKGGCGLYEENLRKCIDKVKNKDGVCGICPYQQTVVAIAQVRDLARYQRGQEAQINA